MRFSFYEHTNVVSSAYSIQKHLALRFVYGSDLSEIYLWLFQLHYELQTESPLSGRQVLRMVQARVASLAGDNHFR